MLSLLMPPELNIPSSLVTVCEEAWWWTVLLDVDKNTFYDWYKIIIKEQDIKAWEEDNRIEIIDKRADKINLKHQIYLDQKKIYSDINSDKEEKEKAMNILLSHFLKRVE